MSGKNQSNLKSNQYKILCKYMLDESCEEMRYLPLKAFNMNCNPFLCRNVRHQMECCTFGWLCPLVKVTWAYVKEFSKILYSIWIDVIKNGDSMLIGTSFSWSTWGKK